VTIDVSPSVVLSGTEVTWTVSETNDGDVALTGVFVNLDRTLPGGVDDGDVAVLDETSASFVGTDTGGDGVLSPGETWTWVVTTTVLADDTVTATGHGIDPLGRDITFPLDPDERASATVDVVFPSTEVTIDVSPSVVLSGTEVTWTVSETNDGDVPLTGVFVNLDRTLPGGVDDGDVAVLDETSASFVGTDTGGDGVLSPGETWTWAVTTIVLADDTVTATGHGIDPLGRDITFPLDAQERASAAVRVVASSTDVDISAEPSFVAPGDEVVWTVVERNDGTTALGDVRVDLSTDGGDTVFLTLTNASATFVGGDSTNPGVLDPGEAWTWQVSTFPADDVTVTATGYGTDPFGQEITWPLDPDERASASVDVARSSTAVTISADPAVVVAGSSVTWTVTETNDGETPLEGVFVNLDTTLGPAGQDDGDLARLDATSPGFTGDDGDGVLESGETWQWVLVTSPSADVTVTATGHGLDPLGRDITWPDDPDERAAASVDVIRPSTMLTIAADPSSTAPGGPVQLTVVERNDGDVPLTEPYVELEDGSGTVTMELRATGLSNGDTNGNGVLDPGEAWTWIVTVTPEVTTTYTATGHGLDPLGRDITWPLDPDERASVTVTVVAGDDGCTPGFWKNHPEDWVGYSPTQLVGSVFDDVPPSLGGATLLQALSFGGGSGTEGAARILLRAGVAALLNAAHPEVSYLLSTAQVIDEVSEALASGSRDTILDLADRLDRANNAGCTVDGRQP
jgi:hypothetical protein